MEAAGRTVREAKPPSNLAQAVTLVSSYEEDDAVAFASELRALSVEDGVELLYQECGRDPRLLEYVICGASMELFARHHLAHHFTSADGKIHMNPKFHGDLIPLLQRVEEHEITKPVVIAGFPECGKTTCISLLLPLHAICHPRHTYYDDGRSRDVSKRFILFMSAIAENAMLLMDPVLRELEENESLIQSYGNLYRHSESNKIQPQWSAKRATTLNGVHLEARSRNTKLRTIKWRQYRPDLVLPDDIEDDKSVSSRAMRQELMTWFTTVLLNRLSAERGNCVFTGNILHEQSLMNNLLVYGKDHGWETRIYRSYELDPKSGLKVYLMPERFGAEWEKNKRQEMMGRESAFDQEFLQNPNAGEAEVSYEDFDYYEPRELEERIEYCEMYTAVDPAASQDQRADFTAIVTLAYDVDTGTCYVLPIVHDHFSIQEQVDAAIRVYTQYQPILFGVEAVGYQKVLGPLISKQADDHGFSIPVVEVKQGRMDKYTRIRRLFPSIKNGALKFLRNDDTHRICIDQLVTISKGVDPENDDAADALEMAKRLQEDEALSQYALSTGASADIL